MKFITAATALALLASSGALAKTNFAGFTVSNSINTGTYVCRTQAEVSIRVPKHTFSAQAGIRLTMDTILQWNQVAADARNNGFGVIRLEGLDCNALDMASLAASANGVKVLAGIYATVSISLLSLSCST